METVSTQLTPDAVVARVHREIARDCEDGRLATRPSPEAIERVVRAAVADLWTSRVKVFIPLLALRTARETLQRVERTTSAI